MNPDYYWSLMHRLNAEMNVRQLRKQLGDEEE
jgi:hypothetical protein